MRIRPDQVTVLNRHSEERFLDRLVELVAENVGSEVPAAEVRLECQRLVNLARRIGFSTEFEVGIFVACGAAFGKDFYSRTDLPFRRMLQDPSGSPAGKSEQMVALLEQYDDGDTNATTL